VLHLAVHALDKESECKQRWLVKRGLNALFYLPGMCICGYC
jgi:hypothetical protein